MAFESPIFLAALAAVAAPVIIHLIFRLRKRVVVFGSLRFLEKIVKKNRRRLRLRDLILLLLRVAAVAMIALAFARPYLRGPGEAGEGEKVDVVFVLDDSFSMSAGRLARANFDEAKARITHELSTLKTGDRAALVLATGGGRVALALTGDVAQVRVKVRAAPPTFERAELAPALRAAAGLFRTSDAPRKRVAVASDLQRTSWTEAALASLPRGTGAGSIEYAAILPPSKEPNVAVVGAEPVTEFWAPGVPVRVALRVANFGAKRAVVSVRLFAGSQKAARAKKTVEVAPGAVAPVELAFDAAAAAELRARVKIDGRDALPADDTRHLVIRLRGRLGVLCIQDEVLEGKRRYDDAGFFLRMSLDPRLDADETPATPFEPRVTESRALTASDLRGADAVFLLGATKLSDESVRALVEWVRAGGGLCVAPLGDPDSYAAFAGFVNGALAEAGLAPARLAGHEEAASESGAGRAEGVRIASWARDHPIWAVFGDGEGTGPDRARAKRFLKLEPVEGARTIAEFEGALPAVAEIAGGEKVGAGRVVLLAFALGVGGSSAEPGDMSTDFPKRKAYVPFVHGLAGYLARAKERDALRAVEVGTALPVAEALAGPEEAGERADLMAPDGSVVPLSAGKAAVADRPGVYRLRVGRKGGTQTTYLAANVPAAESDLRTDGPSAFLAAVGARGPDGATAARRASTGADEARHSALWAVLLGIVGCILMVESLLANRVLLGAERAEAGSKRVDSGGGGGAGRGGERDAGNGEAA